MNFHGKMLLAQAPLALALAILAIVATVTLSTLGRHSQLLLADNYRSVLAMQRAKDALDRMDSGTLFVLAGKREKGLARIADNRTRFEAEVRLQEGNITESGERELTDELRRRWDRYMAVVERLAAANSADAHSAIYFSEAEPAFLSLEEQADRILAVNQDAMLRRSRSARESAADTAELLIGVSMLAAVAGLAASSFLTRRTLRPMAVLQQAAMRLGEGDFSARARIAGRDEIANLAIEFNGMADQLERYRRSSLGELLQAQATAQAAIESLPDPVVLFGGAGEVLNVNRVAESWLGLQLESGDPLQHVPPGIRELLEKVRAHVLGGRGPYVPRGFEESVRVTTPDGDRWLLPRAAPVYGDGGEIAGAAAILQDVSRLRRFDELKNDLVATVAHEFRSPLTSLRMAIHLCLEEVAGPLTAKQADLLYAAREDCDRLQTIVDDLLDLARIQAGRLELRRSPVLAAELVAGAVEDERMAAQEKDLRLVAAVDPAAGEVFAERERIAMVLSNLISNATRHSPRGGTVRVGAVPDGDFVLFSVEDEGPGIAPEHRAEVFQAPGGAVGAAGIGLSISREIVEAHAGSIGIDSEVGRGSRFWFRLPAARRGV